VIHANHNAQADAPGSLGRVVDIEIAQGVLTHPHRMASHPIVDQ